MIPSLSLVILTLSEAKRKNLSRLEHGR